MGLTCELCEVGRFPHSEKPIFISAVASTEFLPAPE